MRCKRCGYILSYGQRYCPYCGAAVNENNNRPIYRDTPKNANKFFVIGSILAIIGILFFSYLAFCWIGGTYRRLYGISFGADTLISAGFMIVGSISIIIGLIKKCTKKRFIFAFIILILSIGLSTWSFLDFGAPLTIYGNNSSSNSSSSTNNNFNSDYNYEVMLNTLNKNQGLELNVDKIEYGYKYTTVYCSVENVSADYYKPKPTSYRYVRVKAQFIDNIGKVVDTDWTYAIGSAWLEPGETTTFKFMVENNSITSVNLSFID